MILLGLAVKPVTYLCRQCNPLVKSGTHVPYRTFVLVLLRTEQSVSLLPKSTSEYQTNGRGANEGINGLLFFCRQRLICWSGLSFVSNSSQCSLCHVVVHDSTHYSRIWFRRFPSLAQLPIHLSAHFLSSDPSEHPLLAFAPGCKWPDEQPWHLPPSTSYLSTHLNDVTQDFPINVDLPQTLTIPMSLATSIVLFPAVPLLKTTQIETKKHVSPVAWGKATDLKLGLQMILRRILGRTFSKSIFTAGKEILDWNGIPILGSTCPIDCRKE